MYLPILSDAELCVHVDATVDAMTTTDVERELLKRLEARVALDDAMINVADEFDGTAEDVRAIYDAHPADLKESAEILAKLNDYDIHTVAQLEEQIERSRKFYDIANDAGDALARLAALAAETQ